MTTIGSYEAKTHLPELLTRASKGEKILITRRGRPIAQLTPPSGQAATHSDKIIENMLKLRDQKGPTHGKKLTIRQMLHEGHRF